MKTAMSFLISDSLLRSVVVLMIQAVLLSAVTVLTYRILKFINHLKPSIFAISAQKELIYDIYGILKYIPSYSTLKSMALPPHVYITQIVGGLRVVYPNAKVVRSTVAFHDFVALTKHESVEEFLNSKVPCVKPKRNLLSIWFGNGLFTRIGPEWKSRRKLLNPLFYSSALKDLVSKFDQHSKVLVDVFRSKLHEKWIDIVDPIAFCSMDIVGDTVLGVDLKTQTEENPEFIEAMIGASKALVETVKNPLLLLFDIFFRISATGRKFKRYTSYLRTFAQQVIEQRKEAINLQQERKKEGSDGSNAEKKDFLAHLLEVQMSNPDFSDEDVKNELVLFIFGAQDTTAAAMAWALYLIGLYPDIQRKIHEELDDIFKDDLDRPVTADDLKEMKYLECVLKESQRLYPSVPIDVKEILEDFQLCECKIKKGSFVFFCPYQIHRDPDVFPNPEKFDPDRFLPENCVGRSPFAYIPFSAGARTCIGRYFAIMEEKTVLANVLRTFSVKSLEHRDKIFPSCEFILRSARPLKMKFSLRYHSATIIKDPP